METVSRRTEAEVEECALLARGQVSVFKVTFEWSSCRSGVHQALCGKEVPVQECKTEAPKQKWARPGVHEEDRL